MQSEQDPKPEDAYMLGWWNSLNNYEGNTDKTFKVDPLRHRKEVLLGLHDPDKDMAIVRITPDQARAIATMLVYAAQEVEK